MEHIFSGLALMMVALVALAVVAFQAWIAHAHDIKRFALDRERLATERQLRMAQIFEGIEARAHLDRQVAAQREVYHEPTNPQPNPNVGYGESLRRDIGLDPVDEPQQARRQRPAFGRDRQFEEYFGGDGLE